MYTLADANVKTSISVLKSDIFQVHLRLQKIKNRVQNQHPQSRRRSEIAAIQKGTAEIEDLIKSWESTNVDHLRFHLARLLNGKMVALEMTVLELSGYVGDLPSTSMSRLPAWFKIVDQYIETNCPDLQSRPESRSEPANAISFVPLENLLTHHSVRCDTNTSSPKYLTDAVAALGAKIEEQLRKIEELKRKHVELECKSAQQSPPNEMVSEDNERLKKDLMASENNVKRLSKRIEELMESTSSVRKSLTAEITQLQADLRRSKNLEEDLDEKCSRLEIESNNMSNRISELRDKLQLIKLKDKKTGAITMKSNANHSWAITQMSSSHDEAMEILKDKNRRLTKQLMQTQENNLDLMETLTNRDAKLQVLKSKDQGFYEIVRAETDAMKQAFEIKLKNAKIQLELSRADTRKVEQQLKDQHKSHLAALDARAKLINFST